METSEASDPSSIDRFLDPSLLGDQKMPFMLPLGQTSKELRQYLASHMLNRERYPKRAPYKQQLHGQAYPRQTPSSLLGGGGSVRCTCISHAKHRCRKPPADHQRPTHALGPCQQKSCKSSAKAPSVFGCSASECPISPTETGTAVRQTTSAQLHKPAPSPLPSLLPFFSLVSPSTRESQWTTILARRHLQKKKRVVEIAAG